ncbi:helix-turn-helix transcriptional regulator [Aerococcaceae bacterium zg-ZJ1578]|uniref:helix-turn-helix transcriptional regulator n=1 Tax=Aerococcaceae bacterium zg-252 TaxID=2796928 RepID=UPI001A18195C|nr:helix-turn-helix transcriptional regulator [Aerococcaceae bacterium zg-1578]
MLTNLENARNHKNISLSQMAAAIGISRYQTISDKINGVSKFSFDEAVKLRKTFFPEYDLEFLFEKTESLV